MQKHHIDDMTSAVLEALELGEDKRDLVARAIRSQWHGKVALVWTRTDIARICDMNLWRRPSADDCDLVLHQLQLHTHGVTDETIAQDLKNCGLAVPEESLPAKAPRPKVKRARKSKTK